MRWPRRGAGKGARALDPAGAVARGMVLLLISQTSLSIAGYVVAVILARGLGPSGYGVYGIVYSVLLGVELIGRFGVPQALSKLIAERSERSTALEGTGITLMLIVYLPIFAAFWVFSPQLAELFHVVDGARLFRIASLDIVFYGMFFVCGHILTGRRRFGLQAGAGLLYAGAKVVGMVWLVYVGISVTGALIVNVVASVVAFAYSASWVGLGSFRATLSHWRSLARLAVPIGLFTLGSQVLISLDLWSLNAVGVDVSEEAKGFYVAASNIARLPNMVGFVMVGVLVPSVARAMAAGKEEAVNRSVRDSARFLAITLLPGCALIAVEAEGLLDLVFSGAYGEATDLLRVLIFGQGLLFTILVTECAILIGCGLAGMAAVITLSLLPVALLLNVVLVAASGAMGAALASLSVNALGAVIAGLVVSRRVAPLMSPRTWVRAILASALVAAAAALLRQEGGLLVVEIAVLLVGYLGIAIALGLLSREDIKLFLPIRTEAPHAGQEEVPKVDGELP